MGSLPHPATVRNSCGALQKEKINLQFFNTLMRSGC